MIVIELSWQKKFSGQNYLKKNSFHYATTLTCFCYSALVLWQTGQILWFIDQIPIEFLEVLVYWHELSSFFGVLQKCFMVVPKETKSQSECVDWFRSNQVEIFNKGGIADIGPSFHAIELLSRELLQYLKSQKGPGCVFLLISSSHYSCVLFHDYIAVTLVWLFG